MVQAGGEVGEYEKKVLLRRNTGSSCERLVCVTVYDKYRGGEVVIKFISHGPSRTVAKFKFDGVSDLRPLRPQWCAKRALPWPRAGIHNLTRKQWPLTS